MCAAVFDAPPRRCSLENAGRSAFQSRLAAHKILLKITLNLKWDRLRPPYFFLVDFEPLTM
jgi:hypothetical protein